jgi:hypothetical protein
MAMDQETERHLETWHGFARLLRWSIGSIVALLVVLAVWLL